jgi:phytoene dehydrogenase-like protein
VRYDAAIIGAGANGLAAAAALARAGLRTIVLERSERCGGRCTTREFHPGFRASPFCDEIAPVPTEIFHALDLARHGAIFLPSASSLAWRELGRAASGLETESSARISGLFASALADASHASSRSWFQRSGETAPNPRDAWSVGSLGEVLDEVLPVEEGRALVLGAALNGRAVDPFLPGSALHLLAPRHGSGTTPGGLETFSNALLSCARAAGVEISLGLEVSDIRHAKRRVTGLRLADGTEIEARAIVSTLDLKRTFSSLFAWKDLPPDAAARVSTFRHAPATARLLLALDKAPDASNAALTVPLRASDVARGCAAWRAGRVCDVLPMTLQVVSAADPRLAPRGKAVLTATLGCVPRHLFDGAWSNEKRAGLRDQALAQVEGVLPGTRARTVAADLIVPPDIEDALGVTEGDLDGGEIAPDQMFAQRGFPGRPGPRTPISGLYLGGHCAPIGTFGSCAAGFAAARAAMTDLATRGFR